MFMLTTTNQVFDAIQEISFLKNVKDNLKLITNVTKSIECGIIQMDELKIQYKKKFSYDKKVTDFFNFLFLKNGTITTLYLLKGIEAILSDKSPTELGDNKINDVYNLHKSVEENGVKGSFMGILHYANLLNRYKSILSLKYNKK